MIDDALSAVDAHVAKHLFDECITKELLTGRGENFEHRSVILATNALQHLNHPRVNKIVVLRDGRIVEQGSYAELAGDKGSEFSRFLAVIEETGIAPSCASVGDDSMEEFEGGKERKVEVETDIVNSEQGRDEGSGKKNGSRLMTTEERSLGQVGVEV